MNIGKSLKVALAKNGLTQKEVSKDLGLHPVVLNRHFTGLRNVTPQYIQIYADYFNMRPSELIALGE